jgi:H+/gluconate symporter-like permease
VLVPAFLFLIVASLLIFMSPSLNGLFTFLHAWQYLFIVLGMIIVTLRVTRKQLKKLFDTSVKNSLKGGNAQ